MTTTVQEEIKEIKNEEQNLGAEEVLLVQEMAENGLLYGLNKSKTHPKMRQHIYTTRSGVEIINLESSVKKLAEAREFLKTVSASGKSVLIVGTTAATKNAVKEIAEKTGCPYVNERWLGGTLTNFKAIGERIKHYNRLVSDKETGALNKYTKKERVLIEKKLEKMRSLFEGISKVTELPGALLILDINSNDTAAHEAKELNIPIVALTNTDTDPTSVKYAIPCNNRLESSVQWILNNLNDSLIKAVIAPVQKEAPKAFRPEAKREESQTK